MKSQRDQQVAAYLIEINPCESQGPIYGPLSMQCQLIAWLRQKPSHHPLQWRHSGHHGVSNHQPDDCLLNRLFRCRSKKISKLRVTVLCVGNSPGTDGFPVQMVSNAENVFIWWRHQDQQRYWHKYHRIWQPQHQIGYVGKTCLLLQLYNPNPWKYECRYAANSWEVN